MARLMALLVVFSLLVVSVPGCAGIGVAAATATPSPTEMASSATPSPSATAEPTRTPTPSKTPTCTPSVTPSVTPTNTATATSTPEPTAEPSPTPSPRPTFTPTMRPSATPTSTPQPSPTSTPEPPTATPRAQAKRAFLGYYVPYDPSSWATLEKQAGSLDYVALQVATLDYCGNVSSRDDRTLLAFAQARGLPVLASLFASSGPLNHSVLTNPSSASNAVEQLVSYVVEVGYDGLDIDLEGVPAEDRAALTSFVARLSAALRERGKIVTMAVPAKTREVTTGWAGAYDYAALAPHLDLVAIMSYAYTTSSTPPGSTAPYDWVDKVAAYVSSQFPPEKVLLGVAFYGYDWNTTSGGRAGALRYPQAEALAQTYGATIQIDPATRSATFTYTAKAGDPLPYEESLPALDHEISVRQAPACPLTPPPPPTPGPRTPTPPPAPGTPQEHTVWLEDAASVAARLGIAEDHGIRGVAAWRLGHEDPGVWAVVEEWKR